MQNCAILRAVQERGRTEQFLEVMVVRLLCFLNELSRETRAQISASLLRLYSQLVNLGRNLSPRSPPMDWTAELDGCSDMPGIRAPSSQDRWRAENKRLRNCCVSCFTGDRDDETSNPGLRGVDCAQPIGHSRRAVVRPCLLRRGSFLCRQILGISRRDVGARSRRQRSRYRNGASLSAWCYRTDCGPIS